MAERHVVTLERFRLACHCGRAFSVEVPKTQFLPPAIAFAMMGAVLVNPTPHLEVAAPWQFQCQCGKNWVACVLYDGLPGAQAVSVMAVPVEETWRDMQAGGGKGPVAA